MNTKLKKKWIDALRSGEYKQARGALARTEHRDDDPTKASTPMCCLGVLLHVAEGNAYAPGLCEGELLSGKALSKFDLTAVAMENLASMNDTKGFGFKKIAKYIEKNL